MRFLYFLIFVLTLFSVRAFAFAESYEVKAILNESDASQLQNDLKEKLVKSKEREIYFVDTKKKQFLNQE